MLVASNELKTAQFLFNQHRYLHAHRLSGITLADDVTDPTCLITCIETEPGIYISGVRAPFGGIECRDIKVVDGMLKELLSVCGSRGAASITIKQAPVFYQAALAAAIHDALLSNGFTLLYSDVNQYMPVDPSIAFKDRIDYQKRRSLRLLKEKGAHTRLFNDIEAKEWYELFLKSRVHKKIPVTISGEAYYQLSKQLPDVYQYAGVFLDGRLIASAVFVRVTADSVYYFLAASDPEYDVLSPSIMLIEALYDDACAKNIALIDLGISSVGGILNEGLHFFKKHAGGIDSQKNTYVYKY